MLAGYRSWMQIPAAVPDAVCILRQARIFLIKPASLDAIEFFSGLSCAGPTVHLLRRDRSSRIYFPVLPSVRFSYRAQTGGFSHAGISRCAERSGCHRPGQDGFVVMPVRWHPACVRQHK